MAEKKRTGQTKSCIERLFSKTPITYPRIDQRNTRRNKKTTRRSRNTMYRL